MQIVKKIVMMEHMDMLPNLAIFRYGMSFLNRLPEEQAKQEES